MKVTSIGEILWDELRKVICVGRRNVPLLNLSLALPKPQNATGLPFVSAYVVSSVIRHKRLVSL